MDLVITVGLAPKGLDGDTTPVGFGPIISSVVVVVVDVAGTELMLLMDPGAAAASVKYLTKSDLVILICIASCTVYSGISGLKSRLFGTH